MKIGGGLYFREIAPAVLTEVHHRLKELPVGITFVHEDGHRICRITEDRFLINNIERKPAKASHLLSGRPVVPSKEDGPSQDTNHTTVQKSSISPRSRETAKTPLVIVPVDPEEKEYQEWKQELAIENYDRRLEKAKGRRREECLRKLQTVMSKIRNHYTENRTNIRPLLNELDTITGSNILMESEFVKKLLPAITESRKYDNSLKLKMQMEEYKRAHKEFVRQTLNLDATRNKIERELSEILDSPRSNRPSSPRENTAHRVNVEPIKLLYEGIPEECFTIE